MKHSKRLCIHCLNNDVIVIATARCLWGLSNSSSWFQCSCGQPAPVNNQPVRAKAALAHSGKKCWSKGQGLPLGRRKVGHHQPDHITLGAAHCCAFVPFREVEEGGIRTGNLDRGLLQAEYLLSMKWEGKICKAVMSPTLTLKEESAFTIVFWLCLHCFLLKCKSCFFFHPSTPLDWS